jgi:hypothetical protein
VCHCRFPLASILSAIRFVMLSQMSVIKDSRHSPLGRFVAHCQRRSARVSTAFNIFSSFSIRR